MSQHSTVNGNNCTVVQVSGNDIDVVLSTSHLPLTRFEAEERQKITDGRILLPAARAIPVVGRENEMDELLKFVNSEGPTAVQARVIVGRGGSGKTRLALALCDQIKETWDAGFVTTDDLRRFSTQQGSTKWVWQRPTLVVLDYAAAHAPVLARWVRDLVSRDSPPRLPLRLLLLERHADPASGWHKSVFNPGGGQSLSTSALLEPSAPVQIAPLDGQFDRLAVVRSVIERINPALSATLMQDRTLTNKVKACSWGGDPLYLAMAALNMARKNDLSAFELPRSDLALQVAGHEKQRLTALAESKNLEPEMIHHLCACITLLQGIPRTEAFELVRQERQATGFDSADPPARTIELLYEAFPDYNDRSKIAPMQPDLIGEAFMLSTWTTPERANAVNRLFKLKPQETLASLAKVIQDFEASHQDPSIWFEDLTNLYWNDPKTLGFIYSYLESI